jgi:hypothetical protein
MVKDMGLRDNEYAVLVADGRPELEWGLGSANINQAPVLLTTHAMVMKRLQKMSPRTHSNNGFNDDISGNNKAKPGSWASLSEFYYAGKPRVLRVWDEAILPGVPLILKARELDGILWAFQRHEEIYSAIDGLRDKIKSVEPGSTVEIPDVASIMGLSATYGRLEVKSREATRQSIETLWTMSGGLARVCDDGRGTNTLLDFRRTLPDDIRPMLVLDASARVRGTYKQQERKTKDIVRLKYVPKRYNRVRFHLKQAGSGKEMLGKKYQERLREIGEVISMHPDRNVLVLHHKPDASMGIGNIEKDLPSYIAKSKWRDGAVKFCHWGVHDARNDLADCDVIITASILHHPRSAYEARGRTASNTPTTEEYDDALVNEIRRGELKHDLLQGLSRGALRQCDGNQAKPCDVYLLAGRNSGIKKFLPELFPGCSRSNGWGLWEGVDTGQHCTDRMLEIKTYVQMRLSHVERDKVPFPEVYKFFGIDRRNFSRTVNTEAFRALIQSDFAILAGYPNVFVRAGDLGHFLFGDGPPAPNPGDF